MPPARCHCIVSLSLFRQLTPCLYIARHHAHARPWRPSSLRLAWPVSCLLSTPPEYLSGYLHADAVCRVDRTMTMPPTLYVSACCHAPVLLSADVVERICHFTPPRQPFTRLLAACLLCRARSPFRLPSLISTRLRLPDARCLFYGWSPVISPLAIVCRLARFFVTSSFPPSVNVVACEWQRPSAHCH